MCLNRLLFRFLECFDLSLNKLGFLIDALAFFQLQLFRLLKASLERFNLFPDSFDLLPHFRNFLALLVFLEENIWNVWLSFLVVPLFFVLGLLWLFRSGLFRLLWLVFPVHPHIVILFFLLLVSSLWPLLFVGGLWFVFFLFRWSTWLWPLLLSAFNVFFELDFLRWSWCFWAFLFLLGSLDLLRLSLVSDSDCSMLIVRLLVVILFVSPAVPWGFRGRVFFFLGFFLHF